MWLYRVPMNGAEMIRMREGILIGVQILVLAYSAVMAGMLVWIYAMARSGRAFTSTEQVAAVGIAAGYCIFAMVVIEIAPRIRIKKAR